MFWSVGWPLLWAAGFFCNLGILYGGLGIGKLQFLIKQKFFSFSAVIFFFKFWSLKPWIRIGLQPQTLDPDPDKDKKNTDTKPWSGVRSTDRSKCCVNAHAPTSWMLYCNWSKSYSTILLYCRTIHKTCAKTKQVLHVESILPFDVKAELVFVDLLRRPGIDSQPGGPVRNPVCRTGPPCYIGWRNRFFGIDSWAS